MKSTRTKVIAERPDGRLDSDEQGYPSGPQGPSGKPCEGASPLRTPETKKTAKTGRNQIIKIRLTTDEMNRLSVSLPIKKGRRRGLSRLVRSRLFASHHAE